MAEEPKYQQVIDWVKENIANGQLRAGDRLMSEMELSEKFSLSRQTIRHATGELEKEHLVTRVKGSGTYIGSGKAAPAAARRRHMRIAVLSTFYESYIFPPTMKGIERVLSKRGYSMQVSFTDNRIPREQQILRDLLEKDNIDGLIVEPAKSALPNPNISYYRELQSRGIPLLFFNTSYEEIDAPCVRLDDERVAGEAARWGAPSQGLGWGAGRAAWAGAAWKDGAGASCCWPGPSTSSGTGLLCCSPVCDASPVDDVSFVSPVSSPSR